MRGEWHGVAGSVMPFWHDVHRTCGAAFLADKAPADRGPRHVLRQGVQPDINQTTAAAVTLDVAGLRGRPRAIPPGFLAGSCRTCGPAFYESEIDACANESDAEPNAQIINRLGIGTAVRY
jgi:hypothetical protein